MNPYDVGLGLLICIIGVGLACLYGRRSDGFSWRKYVALLSAPTLVVALATFTYDTRVLYLYAVSALFGFALEFCLGFTYHKTMRTPLWLYDKDAYPVWRYTSLLTIPMWGVAGVLFWALGTVLL